MSKVSIKNTVFELKVGLISFRSSLVSIDKKGYINTVFFLLDFGVGNLNSYFNTWGVWFYGSFFRKYDGTKARGFSIPIIHYGEPYG
jgi:hypothetical protein|tara:strand:- start:248 stop:508 length:261 start_codon:yes stop_codon:yes gene_type:complete